MSEMLRACQPEQMPRRAHDEEDRHDDLTVRMLLEHQRCYRCACVSPVSLQDHESQVHNVDAGEDYRQEAAGALDAVLRCQ